MELVDVLRVIAITAFAGGTSFVGGLLGRLKFSDTILLFLTAFGAGILMAAAIFSMVISAEKDLGITAMLAAFVAGAIAFAAADWTVQRKKGEAGILLGIGLDSIPESLAIGATIASGAVLAVAVLVGIQNVPEGIASFKEMTTGKGAPFENNRKKALASIGMVSAIPVALGLLGLFFFQGAKTLIAVTLAVSAGGIFYMLFYDMIPKAHREKKRAPTFGAVIGFIVGFAIIRMIGEG
ncbi:MAG: ZIP family metal transporter [Nitrososphaera sp.]